VAFVVLVQALCIEKVDVGHCCMCNLDLDILRAFGLWVGNLFWFEIGEVLRDDQNASILLVKRWKVVGINLL
jgi:hypothetical protein